MMMISIYRFTMLTHTIISLKIEVVMITTSIANICRKPIFIDYRSHILMMKKLPLPQRHSSSGMLMN